MAIIYPVNDLVNRPSAVMTTISTKIMARRIGSIHALAGTRDAPQYLQDVESWSTPLPHFLQNGKPIPYNTTKVIVELKLVEDMRARIEYSNTLGTYKRLHSVE